MLDAGCEMRDPPGSPSLPLLFGHRLGIRTNLTLDAGCWTNLVQDGVSASDQGRRQGAANGGRNQSSATAAVFGDSVQSGWDGEPFSRLRVEQTPGHGSDLIKGIHRVTRT